MNTLLPVFLFLSVFLCSLTGAEQEPEGRGPDAEILAKLQEIVQIRERLLKEQLMIAEMGKGSAFDLIEAKIQLSEAHIAVAEEQDDRNLLIGELKNIVKFHKQRLARESALLQEVDRKTSEELYDFQVALLKAELRLLRAEKDS